LVGVPAKHLADRDDRLLAGCKGTSLGDGDEGDEAAGDDRKLHRLTSHATKYPTAIQTSGIHAHAFTPRLPP